MDLFLGMNSRLEISYVFTISLCEIVSVDGELETVTVLIESARIVVLWTNFVVMEDTAVVFVTAVSVLHFSSKGSMLVSLTGLSEYLLGLDNVGLCDCVAILSFIGIGLIIICDVGKGSMVDLEAGMCFLFEE